MKRTQVVAALAVALPIAMAAAQGTGWHARPEAVVQAARQQPGFNYDESRVESYTLPDPLASKGAKVASALNWPTRRAEILNLFRANVYGRSPARPEHVAFSVIEENPAAMDGAATLRRIAIESRQGSRSHRFALTLFLPNKRSGAAPVFLLINNRPPSNTDPSRKEKSGFWPAEQLIARGYGIAAFHYAELAPDDAETYRDGVMKFFDNGTAGGSAPYRGVRSRRGRGVPAARWTTSNPIPASTRRTSRSSAIRAAARRRFGPGLRTSASRWSSRMSPVKAAQPSAGAISGRPSSGSTRPFRTGSPTRTRTFNGRATDLPVDQHMLLALTAPRALYVASADEDLWSDPRGEFLSLAASSPVFAFWGDQPIRPADMPAVDTPIIVGRRGYHVRTGGHNLTSYDWDRFADFADRVWKK